MLKSCLSFGDTTIHQPIAHNDDGGLDDDGHRKIPATDAAKIPVSGTTASFSSSSGNRSTNSIGPSKEVLYKAAKEPSRVILMPPASANGTIEGNATTGADYILQPQSQDILFGRGKPFQERPGNVWFRNLLESYRDRYEAAGKAEKTKLATEIVLVVKAHKDARFLKQSDKGNYWIEVDDKVAREKVSHSFRTRRSKGKRHFVENYISDAQ